MHNRSENIVQDSPCEQTPPVLVHSIHLVYLCSRSHKRQASWSEALCLILTACCICAESAQTDARVRDLELRAKSALKLPEAERVHYTDLHDAMTSMRFHGKQIPQVRRNVLTLWLCILT